jgi:transcriptional regulator with XRE-family HTH domain
VSRLELAARLRELRQQAGKSLEDAAAELMCSVAKISRMETGGRGVQPRDVRDLSRLYQVSDPVRNELTELMVNSKVSGWWQDFRTLDEQMATVIALEDAAGELRQFEALRVPGLLQSAAFTEALVRNLRPPGNLTEEEIAEIIAMRGRRQKRIESGELRLNAVIDEASVRRPIGDPLIMRDQIDRLIAETERPNVNLQLIPFERGPHPGLDGSFQHMVFSGRRLDAMVYIENVHGNFVLDRNRETSYYRTVFDDLSSHYALDADATHRWLTVQRETWDGMGEGYR